MTDAITIKTIDKTDAIDQRLWDGLANPKGDVYNPFLRFDFFDALEKSGSAVHETGWQPCHLIAENPEKEIIGIVPNYLKSHSQGEYVFDHAWADAYYRHGLDYYPKLQACVPFTPATGRRLLTNNQPDTQKMLVSGLQQVTQKLDFSSAHITFCTEQEAESASQLGWIKRHGQQFHFNNDGFERFDDFLACLASRKRKDIRKERAQAQKDLDIQWKTGSDITEADWDIFFDFYMDTGERKWGTPYLTRSFFSLIGQSMSEDILLILAYENGKAIAAALNFIGSDCLYGRYWGCNCFRPALHFELCYYQAIDYAIAHKLARVEAGAQGAHKIARGYSPTQTYSAHYIADPRFCDAIDHFVMSETEHIEMENRYLSQRTPFKKSP